MHKLKRKLFSQNFLCNHKLTEKLVRSSSICNKDLVVEIGPGKGIITKQLLKNATHVIAVEIDSLWYKYLKRKFSGSDKITLYQKDFLEYRLPALPYKVFANIPFSIEGEIVRKLIDDNNPPDDCYLVVRKEFGYRLLGRFRTTMFTAMYKPWFSFSIEHHFKRTDFIPIPRVNAVLFRFSKRKKALLALSEQVRYVKFIRNGFGNGLSIITTLKYRFGLSRTVAAIKKISAIKSTKPGHLGVDQWLILYKELTK